MPLPPWLQGTSPQDYVAAAEHGAQIGLGIAHARNAAQEASARNVTEQAAIAERANAARSEQALREWETRERMKLSLAQEQGDSEEAQARLAQGGQYNLARLALETAQNKAREDAINETTRHHGVLEAQGAQKLSPDYAAPSILDLGGNKKFVYFRDSHTGHVVDTNGQRPPSLSELNKALESSLDPQMQNDLQGIISKRISGLKGDSTSPAPAAVNPDDPLGILQ